MAVCMIFTASSLSLTDPMCQPPRQMIETLTPVLPRGRCGRPVEGVSSAIASSEERASAAVPAIPARRNSRRELSVPMWNSLGAGILVLGEPSVLRQEYDRVDDHVSVNALIGNHNPAGFSFPEGECAQ